MRTLHLAPNSPGIDEAAALLRAGALVVMPTETVFGLAANAQDPSALARIYAAKGRPSDNPLIVHLSDAAEVGIHAVADARARLLANALWPGPLTLVLEGRGLFGAQTLALRVPAQPIAREIIRRSARPIAAPSANRSGRPSPTSFEDALREMDGRVEAIVAGPRADYGIESTVLDLTSEEPAILRPGAVSAETISRILGGAALARPEASRLSPGTRYRHYAPDVRVTLYSGPPEAVRDMVAAALSETPASVYIGLRETAPDGASGLLCDDLLELQAGLYAALLHAERVGRPIVAALPEESPDAEAVRDRLRRAAGGRVIAVGTGGEAI